MTKRSRPNSRKKRKARNKLFTDPRLCASWLIALGLFSTLDPDWFNVMRVAALRTAP